MSRIKEIADAAAAGGSLRVHQEGGKAMTTRIKRLAAEAYTGPDCYSMQRDAFEAGYRRALADMQSEAAVKARAVLAPEVKP
jgi:hypothetical protein